MNTSAGDSGLMYMWYNCCLYLFVPPSALNATVTNPFFVCFSLPPSPPLFTHPSSLYLTGDKVWASS